MNDNIEKINHPTHYNHGKIETIRVINDWKLNFNAGNAIKYISRYQHSSKGRLDLLKAIWYLKQEVKNLQKNY